MIKLITILILALLFIDCNAAMTEREIESIAKEIGYKNPALVVAIAKIESSYNPKAHNGEGSGSYGLMQVQCDTAKSPAFGSEAMTGPCAQLYDPKLNIKYGIKWLEYVEENLQVPNIRNIMSAYNAGFDANNKKCASIENNRCQKYLYATRRCKYHNVFNYEGYPPQECHPGQHINETYVKKLFKMYFMVKTRLAN